MKSVHWLIEATHLQFPLFIPGASRQELDECRSTFAFPRSLPLTCLIIGQAELFTFLYFTREWLFWILPEPPQAWEDTSVSDRALHSWRASQTLRGNDWEPGRAGNWMHVHELCTQSCWLSEEYQGVKRWREERLNTPNLQLQSIESRQKVKNQAIAAKKKPSRH